MHLIQEFGKDGKAQSQDAVVKKEVVQDMHIAMKHDMTTKFMSAQLCYIGGIVVFSHLLLKRILNGEK